MVEPLIHGAERPWTAAYPEGLDWHAVIPSRPLFAVLGLPDPYWGQKVNGFVVPAPDQELEADALLTFLQDKLSPVEIPKRIEFRGSLPRSAIGKVLKAELLAEPAAGSH